MQGSETSLLVTQSTEKSVDAHHEADTQTNTVFISKFKAFIVICTILSTLLTLIYINYFI